MPPRPRIDEPERRQLSEISLGELSRTGLAGQDLREVHAAKAIYARRELSRRRDDERAN